MTTSEPLMIDCDVHGTSASCVVCRHLATECERVVGFVENSDDPNDLQAWCDECEQLFAEEQDLTERFREFCDIMLVCTGCYAEIKERHSRVAE